MINVDFSMPSKRGREIFGTLVAYGEGWRTGANRATSFTTNSALVVGEREGAADQYTHYSILTEDGGTLITNTQTGQGGTTYNPDRSTAST